MSKMCKIFEKLPPKPMGGRWKRTILITKHTKPLILEFAAWTTENKYIGQSLVHRSLQHFTRPLRDATSELMIFLLEKHGAYLQRACDLHSIGRNNQISWKSAIPKFPSSLKQFGDASLSIFPSHLAYFYLSFSLTFHHQLAPHCCPCAQAKWRGFRHKTSLHLTPNDCIGHKGFDWRKRQQSFTQKTTNKAFDRKSDRGSPGTIW